MPGINLTSAAAAAKCGPIADPNVVEALRAQAAEATPASSSAPTLPGARYARPDCLRRDPHIHMRGRKHLGPRNVGNVLGRRLQ